MHISLSSGDYTYKKRDINIKYTKQDYNCILSHKKDAWLGDIIDQPYCLSSSDSWQCFNDFVTLLISHIVFLHQIHDNVLMTLWHYWSPVLSSFITITTMLWKYGNNFQTSAVFSVGVWLYPDIIPSVSSYMFLS